MRKFLSISDPPFGNRDRGALEIFLLAFSILVFILCTIFYRLALSHFQFLELHRERMISEYEIEGVLAEVLEIIEIQSPEHYIGRFSSRFVPTYQVTVTRDTITITKEGEELVRARFEWRKEKPEIVAIENPFVSPYMR